MRFVCPSAETYRADFLGTIHLKHPKTSWLKFRMRLDTQFSSTKQFFPNYLLIDCNISLFFLPSSFCTILLADFRSHQYPSNKAKEIEKRNPRKLSMSTSRNFQARMFAQYASIFLILFVIKVSCLVLHLVCFSSSSWYEIHRVSTYIDKLNSLVYIRHFGCLELHFVCFATSC